MKIDFTWLHLSDLHARSRNDWDFEKIRRELILDIKSFASKGFRPDFIFFTGDAAFGAADGESLDTQYEKAGQLLTAVINAFDPPIPLSHLYIVPGNHDIDRNEITPDQTDWLRSPERKLSDIISAIRDEKKQWKGWMERLNAYRSFLKNFGLNHLSPDDPHLIWAIKREVCGKQFGISGLNSAWSCSKNDKGKIWCGYDYQIAELQRRLGKTDISFALIHHPSNWFTEHEDPSILRQLRSSFQIVLHGHEHQSWVDIDSKGSIISSAGAVYQCSWMENGYSWGSVNPSSGTGNIWLRQWDNSGKGWVSRNIASRTTDGVWPLNNLGWLTEPTRKTSSPTEQQQNTLAQRTHTPLDIKKYETVLLTRFRHLRLETLTADQTHYHDVELKSVFIPHFNGKANPK